MQVTDNYNNSAHTHTNTEQSFAITQSNHSHIFSLLLHSSIHLGEQKNKKS